MTKILFVDDDAIARRNIRTKIDWKSYNWELIYTAKDAVDALDFMKQNQPDIILSDIKMPIMDGIQMAMVARNYYPDIKYIFISGYKEFEYAKQALKLNAVDYLNKPLETKQLVQVLREAERLSKEAKRNNDILRDKYPFLQRHYLSQLMYQHFREIDAAVFKALTLICPMAMELRDIYRFVRMKIVQEQTEQKNWDAICLPYMRGVSL